MKIVDHKTLKSSEPIQGQAASSLRRWWAGTGNEAHVKQAESLIRRAHTLQAWIACDCLGDVAEPPYLGAVLKGKTYFLRRLMKKSLHREGCEFFFEQRDYEDRALKAGQGVGVMGGVPDFGATPKGEKVSRPNTKQEKATGDSRARVPRLAKLLWWLAHASQWQSDTRKSPVEALVAIAQDLPLGGTGLPLSKALYATPKAWQQGWFKDSLANQKRVTGKDGVCWWVMEIHDYDDANKRLAVSSGLNVVVAHVDGPVRFWGGDFSPARFPMVAIARIEPDATNVFAIKEVYAHPCERDGGWMLVDSDAERQTLKDIRGVRSWMYAKNKTWFDIEKPLFEWMGSGEKPDFVLTQAGQASERHCIVETMGFNDPEYLDRKAELRANLMQIAETIMDNRCDKPDPAALRSAIARWAMRP